MKIDKIFEKFNCEALLVEDYYNIRFLSGFTGSNGLLLITKELKYLITDFRYIEQAKKQSEKNGFEVIKQSSNVLELVMGILEKENIKTVGIEDSKITLEKYRKIGTALKNIELIELGDTLGRLRMVKREEEIENIKKAVEITDLAFSKIIKKIKVGVSEKELAAELEYIMKLNGAEDRSFETIVASGYRSAMPHGVASDKLIEKEEFIKFDFGCYYNGYVSDMTRTIYFGEDISEKHKKIYSTVLTAQKMALKAVKAGIKANELDKVARDYIEEKGFGHRFGHGLGHGIGLEIHEAPTVSPKNDDILEENMLITIEPGIYIEGFGGVRIEDDVVVKKDGCEVLNKTPKELLIIS